MSATTRGFKEFAAGMFVAGDGAEGWQFLMGMDTAIRRRRSAQATGGGPPKEEPPKEEPSRSPQGRAAQEEPLTPAEEEAPAGTPGAKERLRLRRSPTRRQNPLETVMSVLRDERRIGGCQKEGTRARGPREESITEAPAESEPAPETAHKADV